MVEKETVFDGYERAKFTGFGSYKDPRIEPRVNEIIEATKNEYPNIDNYFLWLCATDYVMEELGLKKDIDKGKEMYEDYLKERKTFIYNNVIVEEENKIKCDYTILQEVE